MTKKISFIMITIALIAVIALAAVFYPKLSDNYSSESSSAPDGTSTTLETQEPDEFITSAQPQKAPDFTVRDINGNEVSLSDYAGKPVVLNFWATWCTYCKTEMPAYDRMYQKYSNSVEFLIINQTDGYQDTVKSASEFIKDSGYSFPIYFDTEFDATYAYNVYSIPKSFFIDSNGNLVATHSGAMSEDTLEEYIINLK